MSDLDFGLCKSLKVKSDSTVGLSISDFLLHVVSDSTHMLHVSLTVTPVIHRMSYDWAKLQMPYVHTVHYK